MNNQDISNEITINSTDEERTRILSKKSLVIVAWNQSKEMVITDPNESTAKALKRYSKEMGLRDKEIIFSEFYAPIRFSQSTLKESITQMTKRNANLVNLGKLLSVLEPVCKNAIKIEVEAYRHLSRKGQEVKQMHQLLSAFHDGGKAYPVKITIHEKEKQPNQFYMVVTVGEIDISQKIKEALTNTGADHQEMNGSLSDGGASFVMSIPSFVANFKRDESIILKNFPDGLLSKEQQMIKQKVLENDIQKETEIQIRLSSNEIKQLESQGFTENDIDTVIKSIDNISKISSAQLENVEESLNTNREVIKEQALEQEREIRARNQHTK